MPRLAPRVPRLPAPGRLTSLLLGASLALLPIALPQRAEAFLVLRMKQTNLGIEVNGGGKYSTVGLTKVPNPDSAEPPIPYYITNPADLPGPELQPASSYLFVGGPQSGDRQTWLWSGITSSAGWFGTNEDVWPGNSTSASTGPAFGVDGGFEYLLLPSGSECSEAEPCDIGESTTIFSYKSFADLGITPGTYTWAWGDGGENQELRLEIEVPVPGPLPALGAAAAFTWSRRLRRRAGGLRVQPA